MIAILHSAKCEDLNELIFSLAFEDFLVSIYCIITISRKTSTDLVRSPLLLTSGCRVIIQWPDIAGGLIPAL